MNWLMIGLLACFSLIIILGLLSRSFSGNEKIFFFVALSLFLIGNACILWIAWGLR